MNHSFISICSPCFGLAAKTRAVSGWAVHRLCFVVLMVIVASGPGCAAMADELPNAPWTQAKFNAMHEAFLHRTLLEPYMAQGHRDPAWDDKAVELIEDYIKAEAQLPGSRSVPDRVKLADEILAAGCRDPLIGLIRKLANISQRWFYTSDTSHEWITARLDDHPYNTLVQAHVASLSSAYMLTGSLHHKEQDRAILIPYLDRLATDDTFTESERRLRLFYISRTWYFRHVDPGMTSELAMLLQSKEMDPWVKETLLGLAASERAQQARGLVPSRLNQAQQRAIKKHMDEAAERLTRAHEMDPTAPEPATGMVNVCAGQGDRAMSQYWFQLAVAAQIDHEPAWSNRLWSVQFWSSELNADQLDTSDTDVVLDEICMIIAEALDAQRFDTRLPGRGLEALYDYVYMGGLGRESSQLQDPKWPARVADTLRGYQQVGWREDEFQDWCGKMAAVSYRMQWWQVAHEASGMMTQPLDSILQRMMLVWNPRLDNEAAARASSLAHEINTIEEMISADEWRHALEFIDTALLSIPADDPSVNFLQMRRRQAQWRIDFDQGEFVDLPVTLDEGDWFDLMGNWTIPQGPDNDKGFYSRNHQEASLVTDWPIGKRWEMSGRLNFPDLAEKEAMTAGGVIIHHVPAWLGAPAGVFFFPGETEGIVVVGPPVSKNMETHRIRYGRVPSQFEFRIVNDDGLLDVWINEEQWFASIALPHVDLTRIYYPVKVWTLWGFGGNDLWGNRTVEYSNIKVRKLE